MKNFTKLWKKVNRVDMGRMIVTAWLHQRTNRIVYEVVTVLKDGDWNLHSHHWSDSADGHGVATLKYWVNEFNKSFKNLG